MTSTITVNQDTVWISGNDWAYVPDVTAWEEAEPKYLSDLDDGLIKLPDRNETIFAAILIVRRARLEVVFDEAVRRSAYIVWLDSLPIINNTSSSLKKMLEYMLDRWCELPAYIEVNKSPRDRFRYSIKPVWEL